MAGFVSYYQSEFASGTITMNVPTGTLNGMLMVLGLTRTKTMIPSDIASQGWTALFDVADISRHGTTAVNSFGTYYRVASSEPASYTFHSTGAGTYFDAIIGSYNTGGATPVGALYDTQDSGTDTVSTATAADADPNSYDETIVYVYTGQGFGTVNTITPAGAPVNDRFKAADATGPANQLFLGLADEDFSHVANYSARTFTCKWNKSDFNGVQVVRVTGIKQVPLGNDQWAWAEAQSDSWGIHV